MNRSFTTPESRVDQCPLCDKGVQTDKTSIFGNYDCPDCGRKLWFLGPGEKARFFDDSKADQLREFVIEFIADRLELDPARLASDPDLIDSHDTDSLERLEVLMELEEALELEYPPPNDR